MIGLGLYDAKKSLIDYLQSLSIPSGLLDGVQVEYNWQGDALPLFVYGGGIRFTHDDDVAEGPGILINEISSVALYVQATQQLPASVKDTDAEIERIANIIIAAMKLFSGPVAWRGISSGQSDYSIADDEVTSILALQVLMGQKVSYD